MRRITRNYILNAMFGLVQFFHGVSGFILWFVLPGGGYRYRGGLDLGEVSSTVLFARYT